VYVSDKCILLAINHFGNYGIGNKANTSQMFITVCVWWLICGPLTGVFMMRDLLQYPYCTMNGRCSGTFVVVVHPTSRLCDSLEPEKTNGALLENNQQE
jgi:hypothetical protein